MTSISDGYGAFVNIVLAEIIPGEYDLSSYCYGSTKDKINTKNTAAVVGSGNIFEQWTAHNFYKKYSGEIWATLNHFADLKHTNPLMLCLGWHNKGEYKNCWTLDNDYLAHQYFVIAAVEMTIADIAKNINEYIDWELEYTPSDIPMKGNICACGMPKCYEKHVKPFEARFNEGEYYVWCDLRITATFNEQKYTNSVCAVSVTSEKHLKKTYDELKQELIKEIRGF